MRDETANIHNKFMMRGTIKKYVTLVGYKNKFVSMNFILNISENFNA